MPCYCYTRAITKLPTRVLRYFDTCSRIARANKVTTIAISTKLKTKISAILSSFFVVFDTFKRVRGGHSPPNKLQKIHKTNAFSH